MASLLTKNLGVVCPSCDYLNVVAAIRCMSCGVSTDDAAPPPAAVSSAATQAEMAASPPGLRRSSPSQHPPPQPVRAPAAKPVPPSSGSGLTGNPSVGPKFGLTVLAGPARGQRFRLASTGAQLGRGKGAILFPDDPFISPLHATLSVREGKLFVRDESSTSGVYVSITNTETIPANGTFCTGLRLFRFIGAVEPSPPWNQVGMIVYGTAVPNGQIHYLIEEVMLGDRPARCLLSPGPVLTVGQGKCDFSYPNDEGLAPRHCEISPLPDGAMIRDLSGGLGTYVRITGERMVKPGDRLRVGQQTLQVEAI